MIRKLSTVEIISSGYLLYFFITLYLEPSLFEKEKSDLYKALIKVIPSQEMWTLSSILLILIFFITLFIKSYIIKIIINLILGSFMLLISVTYMFVYPTIGAGSFLMIGIMHYYEIFKISNQYEDKKTNKMKKAMNTKNLICMKNKSAD